MSTRDLIATFAGQFQKTKSACERAVAQVSDAQLHQRINPLQNSIATIIQHMAGNMESRWTNFLTTDGEKPNRDRDSEFTERHLPRAELLSVWEHGWRGVFDALATLSDADLGRTVTIRTQPLTVLEAIVRQIEHYGWHAGQIALIGKHLVGDRWNYLTIPPGGAAAFNKSMGV